MTKKIITTNNDLLEVLEEIELSERRAVVNSLNWHRIIAKRALYALLMAFLACVIGLFAIQNLRSWKQEVEKAALEQTELTKEVIKTIKDMSWIHMQRIMIKDLLNLSKVQIEDFKKMKMYKLWEKEQFKKLEVERERRRIKQNMD